MEVESIESVVRPSERQGYMPPSTSQTEESDDVEEKVLPQHHEGLRQTDDRAAGKERAHLRL